MSPGPNDYNNVFVKGCWPLIAQDFYKLGDAFFDEDLCFRSINNSYITLIPKDGPKRVRDYRPISLYSTIH
jgi:hypothetical protein